MSASSGLPAIDVAASTPMTAEKYTRKYARARLVDPGSDVMSSAPIVSHEVVNSPSAVAPVVSRARKAMIVPRNCSGKTNATRISPAFLTSAGAMSSIPSAPRRNMPMPNAKNPRGSPLPIGRTKIRVIGGICWPEPFEATGGNPLPDGP